MKKILNKALVSGEPFEIRMPCRWNFGCCKCGLVHTFIIEGNGTKGQIICFSNEYETLKRKKLEPNKRYKRKISR